MTSAPEPGATAVEVDGLIKRYPKATVNAVDGISFAVTTGEVFGLLGPNGAGKTTTVGMLTTRVKPTAGRATLVGIDVAADPVRARTLLAVVPQRSNLDRSLSIRRNLTFHARYHGVSPAQATARANELLDQFGLLERANNKPGWFSGGQAQRVMIARALMHEPKVLFLDEPSTGLDPAARLFMWDRVRELQERGVTVILTTHDMHEAASLSDRVGIVDHGKLLALDTPEALMRGFGGQATLGLKMEAVNGQVLPGVEEAVSQLGGVDRVELINDDAEVPGQHRMRLYVECDAATLIAPAAALIEQHGLRLSEVDLGTPTLEDVFLHLTGRTLR